MCVFEHPIGSNTLRTCTVSSNWCDASLQVGMDEILKCIGIATDMCGVPTLTDETKEALKSPEGADVTSLIPDQVRESESALVDFNMMTCLLVFSDTSCFFLSRAPKPPRRNSSFALSFI